MTTQTSPIPFNARTTSTPFASARTSNDRGLAAFAAALLAAFALAAGAFLPKLDGLPSPDPSASGAASYAAAPAAPAKRS
jgi:hypothetical protein